VFLGAAKVDDMHLVVGELEREADPATARGRRREGIGIPSGFRAGVEN